jgi:hypothetical protein
MTEFRTDAAFSTISGTHIPTVEKLRCFNNGTHVTPTVSLKHSIVEFNLDNSSHNLTSSDRSFWETPASFLSTNLVGRILRFSQSGVITFYLLIQDSDDVTKFTSIYNSNRKYSITGIATDQSQTLTRDDGSLTFLANLDSITVTNDIQQSPVTFSYYEKANIGIGNYAYNLINSTDDKKSNNADNTDLEYKLLQDVVLPNGRYIGQQLTIINSNSLDNIFLVINNNSNYPLVSGHIEIVVWDGLDWKKLTLV